MNKKGFTLIELLMTIAIISLITAITVPSIIFVNKKIKARNEDARNKLILNAAKMYGKDVLFKDNNTCKIITVNDLINNGYYDEKDNVDKTKKVVVRETNNFVKATFGESC